MHPDTNTMLIIIVAGVALMLLVSVCATATSAWG